MALSTCVKCDGHNFEIKEVSPNNGSFKYYFVQCSSCGGVVGVVEYYNTGAILHKLAKKLGVPL